MGEYPNRPFIGVGVIVFQSGRVLLIKRGKPPRAGSWSLPGGRQELGETVRETAAREVREEAGIDVAVLDLLDVVDSINRDDSGVPRFHYTLIDFLAEWRAGKACPGDDAVGLTWADPLDLAPYTLWKETERVIMLGWKALYRHRALREAPTVPEAAQ